MREKNVLFPAEALEVVISTNNCQISERKKRNNIFREALKDIGQFWGSEKCNSKRHHRSGFCFEED